MEKVRFGIIGLGNMGSGHLRSFADGKIGNGVVTAAADVDPAKLENAARITGGLTAFASGEALIDRADVDAVIVATPHYSHPALSIRALQKGLNVVCEKPAGVYTKQVKEMNAAAEAADGLFTVMFNQRTNPLYKKMRALVSEGALGAIKRVNWIVTDWYRAQCYYDSSAWRATWAGEGGGVLFNQCPHQLDLLQWITGMMPERVRAFCRFGKWHDIEVEDDVTAYMEFPDGATGVFVTTTADTPGTNRLEIAGDRGKLVCENGILRFYRLETGEREFNRTYKGGFGEPKFTVEDLKGEGENTQHAGILNNFVDAVLGRAPLYVDGREGIKSVQLMDAMLLSTWLDKMIELPFDDELYLLELTKRIRGSKKKNGGGVILNVEGTYGK